MDILIIDDNAIDLFIAERVLSNLGIKDGITTCNSVSAAISMLHESLYKSEIVPSLIFLDIIMPLYDAYDFLEKFDQLFKSIDVKPNIIVYSASLNSNHKEKLMLHPSVIDYLDKPLSHEYVKMFLLPKYYSNEFANLRE